uniref:alpha-amylase n=1 Tax=Euplotes harpa TaxID=151035 RepID=A0A7S3N697_9SPIT
MLLVSSVYSHTKEEWKSRSIYQVLTDRFARTDGGVESCKNLGNYCGGTYKGLINNLDYIQNMGFDAIWVTPIVKNLPGGYHGYWATDLYSLNENFGTEQDFKDLVTALHNRGMWIMVDVVANHMGPVGQDYSGINPFNQPEHYHDYCIINDSDFANDQWRVENCRLADLPDLKQENDFVKNTLLSWISDLVLRYNIDGLRIDTIPEVPKWFWSSFQQSAGVYCVGEVFDGRIDYVADYQNHVDALLNYPLRFTMIDVWKSGRSFYDLRQRLNDNKNYFKDVNALGVFVDNHDNARFLYQNTNQNGFKSALLFALFTEGIPITYYGSEQGYGGGNDPNNREQLWTNMDSSHPIYQMIKTANGIRKSHEVWKYPQVERYVDNNFYAFSRGNVLIALTNTDGNIQRTVTYLPFNEGDYVCNILGDSDCATINQGKLNVDLSGYKAKIYVKFNSLPKAETE